MKYDYLIAGSGLYGAVFAYEMKKRGKKCLVIDKRNHIGGNIYCEKIDDINVHKYGAHIFILQIKKCGNILTSLQSLIITLIHRLPDIKTNYTIFRLI